MEIDCDNEGKDRAAIGLKLVNDVGLFICVLKDASDDELLLSNIMREPAPKANHFLLSKPAVV